MFIQWCLTWFIKGIKMILIKLIQCVHFFLYSVVVFFCIYCAMNCATLRHGVLLTRRCWGSSSVQNPLCWSRMFPLLRRTLEMSEFFFLLLPTVMLHNMGEKMGNVYCHGLYLRAVGWKQIGSPLLMSCAILNDVTWLPLLDCAFFKFICSSSVTTLSW